MTEKLYFSKDFAESRRRFTEMAKTLPRPAVLGQWAVPSPTDSDLFVDHVWLPPSRAAKKLFVITSGVHGSETYAGAAILQMLMQEILPTLKREDIGVWLVHALNPYGYKHHQRCTQGAVNLNRNFSVSGKIFSLRDEETFRLNEKFLPKKPVASLRSFFLQSLEMREGRAFFDGISLDQLTKTVAPGQFLKPEYLEYGGQAMEPQSLMFVNELRRHMSGFKDIVGLDLHTGLGHRGRLHLLSDGPECVNEELFAELFHPVEDEEFYVFTPAESEGFYEVFGSLNSAFAELAEPSQRICSVTMEFGTLGHSLEDQLKSMNGMFLQHQGDFYGYTTSELKAAVEAMSLDRSYPNDDKWRTAVVHAARETLRRVFQRA